MFDTEAFDAHEAVHAFCDPDTGLRAFIAIHSTARGPAAGGVRLWRYGSSADAMRDVLRLSRGMSLKNAVAGLDLGGGKSVIMEPEPGYDRRALFAAFGQRLHSLGGRYFAAEDVGVSPSDMRVVAEHTPYVAGLPEASGDPSPVTALGVFRGMKAAVARALGRDDLAGVRVGVQGVGHVGAGLCAHLAEAGAELFITDINADGLEAVRGATGAKIVEPDAIYDADVDVFAPCALGAVVNPSTIDRLKCKVIAGAANNQLLTPDFANLLRDRGILYAPDFVINGGGIINVAAEIRGGFDPAWVERKLDSLIVTLDEVLNRAASEARTPLDVALELAQSRIEDAATAREPA